MGLLDASQDHLPREALQSSTGRAAQGNERERLWARWQEIDKNLDAYAARRSTETAIVILEPRLES